MAEYALTANSPLGGYRETFVDAELEERPGIAIVSIAVPQGGGPALGRAIDLSYGASLPMTGNISKSRDGHTWFLGMSPDQIFAVFDDPTADAVRIIAGNLENSGYFTLQSDNWVKLRISGPNALAALSRICPVDLDPSVFLEDRVARTVIEHIGVIVLPEGGNAYLLLAASSMAASFLDAVRACLCRVSTSLRRL